MWQYKKGLEVQFLLLVIEAMNGVLDHNSALQGYTGLGATWSNDMNLLRIMPLVQDQSLDLLISSPAHYHCATDASSDRGI